MIDQTAELRSRTDRNAAANSSPSADHRPTSGADDSTDARVPSNTKPRGRKHPALATVRLRHGTKGRACDAARARGMSLCAFIREAVRDALDTHEKSPNAV